MVLITCGITAFIQTITSPDEWEGDHGHWGTTVGLLFQSLFVTKLCLFTYLMN